MSSRKTATVTLLLTGLLLIFHISAKRFPTSKETESFFSSVNKPIKWFGRIAPDFELKLLNGQTFKLSEHVGKKIIILNFFATWCGPCREEVPELNRFYKKYKNLPVMLIGINAGESEAKVKGFIEKFKVAFPVGIDEDEEIQHLYTVTGFPTTVLIGANGVVHVYEVGAISNADVAFKAYVEENLKIIKENKGITKEAYLKKLKQQKDTSSRNNTDKEKKLTGRARKIAAKMVCPCGCSQKVIDCNCKTAKDIKKALRQRDLSGKTDTEIIKELNREFCVGNDKG